MLGLYRNERTMLGTAARMDGRDDAGAEDAEGGSMTPERIAELRALAEKATPAPWYAHRAYGDDNATLTTNAHEAFFDQIISHREDEYPTLDEHDADFIAAARTALPEALDAIERVRTFCETHRDGPDLPTDQGQVWSNAIAHVLAALEGR